MTREGERQRALVARGLCPSCGEPAKPGRTRCDYHLAYDARLKKRFRDARRAAGLCVAAGCGRAGDPLTGRCALHRAKNAAAWQRNYAKRKSAGGPAEPAAADLCVSAGVGDDVPK